MSMDLFLWPVFMHKSVMYCYKVYKLSLINKLMTYIISVLTTTSSKKCNGVIETENLLYKILQFNGMYIKCIQFVNWLVLQISYFCLQTRYLKQRCKRWYLKTIGTSLSFFMMMKILLAVKLLNTPISFKANSSSIINEMSRKYDVKSLFGYFAIWQLWHVCLVCLC
jgi:hypothetical protein